CLYDTLNIKNYDCFMTYCAKCYLWQSVGEEFLPDRIASKFGNCHKHIETELSVLQPLLLIAFEETVVDLLKIHYQIDGFSGTPCLCQVSIDGKIYPLLALPQAISQEEIADLSFKLSNLANEVKTILSQQREMLETKPRTVRFSQ
ncbi:MAG: hypothetical protein LBD59_02995, partial [Prevotellaceae bacterium]|nr:hypothetical protein [Prevotellaceae bacterium]